MFLLLFLSIIFSIFGIYSARLVLLLTDGFAGHYLQKIKDRVGYQQMIEYGVWCDRLYPEFPTLSLPNHYSLMTGRHPVNHGIVGNYMYDSTLNQFFSAASKHGDFAAAWWSTAEPIWTTAAKQNINTGLYFWIGCDVKFVNKTRPSICVPHKVDSADATLTLLTLGDILPVLTTHDFILLYHKAIDVVGHTEGIQRIFVEGNQVFDEFGIILDHLTQMVDHMPDLQMLVVSDHGMTNLPEENRRYLEDFINMDLIHLTIDSGALKQIIPKEGMAETIYEHLRHKSPIPNVKIYWTIAEKSDLPLRFHYFHSARISQLVLIAETGYGIFTKRENKQFPKPTIFDWALGMHGYDNYHPHMFGILMAYGTAFKSGYRKHAAGLIDIHPLMCHLLNISCPRQTDADFAHIRDILISSSLQNYAKLVKWNSVPLLFCLVIALVQM